MPTLEEILNDGFGIASASQVKTAGQAAPESDEIEKLAMEIGLLPEEVVSQTEIAGETKEAHMSLESLYNQAFPSDDNIVASGSEKVASQDKEAAAIEEAMGELAFDSYQDCLAAHITKIAEALAGGVNISAEAADGTPLQTMKSNEVKEPSGIDTKPQVQDQLMGNNPKGKSGEFETEETFHGELRKQASRKALLLSLIEKEGE